MESDCGFFVVVDLHGFGDWLAGWFLALRSVMARYTSDYGSVRDGAGTKDAGQQHVIFFRHIPCST
jgi:hypothetical protein